MRLTPPQAFVRVTLGALALAASLTACTTPLPSYFAHLYRPTDIAVGCYDGAMKPLDFAVCDKATQADVRRVAFVTGGDVGDLALIDLTNAGFLDTDPKVPGFTRLPVGALPTSVALDPTSPRYVYVGNGGSNPGLTRVDPQTFATAFVSLPARPTRLTLVSGESAGSQRLAASSAESGTVFLVDVAIFDTNDAPNITAIALGGAPRDLAWQPATKTLYVSHATEAHVDAIDLASGGAVIARLSVGAACSNGIDDDGDGLVDAADPGCERPDGPFEEDAERGAACTNGLDDDRDGLADADDPGCAATPTVAACRNGVDDDGDGKADWPDDAGCATAWDRTEGSESLGTWSFECMNGSDDDGDGHIDWPSDTDCFSRADVAEAAKLELPLVDLALATLPHDPTHTTEQDRPLLVATNRTTRMLYAFDATTHSRIDLNDLTTIPSANSMLAYAHETGFAMPGLPVGLAPTTLGGDALLAVAFSNGAVGFLALTKAYAQTWQWIPPSTVLATRMSRPTLRLGPATIDIGAVLEPRFANLGPLAVEDIAGSTDGAQRFYGVTFGADTRVHRAESWSLTYEGILPAGSRATGRFVDPTHMHDAAADFCAIGVEPGDRIVVDVPQERTCAGVATGGKVTWRVKTLTADTIEIDPATGGPDLPVTLENQASWSAPPPQALDASCLGTDGFQYTIRAADAWLVVGSLTGYVHPFRNEGGTCVVRDDATSQTTGRAREARLKTGQALSDCPILVNPPMPELDYAPLDTPIFSFAMVPGCFSQDDGTKLKHVILPTPRDLEWRFGVAPSTSPRLSATGANPQVLRSVGTGLLAYVVDAGFDAVFSVNPYDGATILFQ